MGSNEQFFQGRETRELGKELSSWGIGFGPETRDCTLLHAANHPVFIADNYARLLLRTLTGMPLPKADNAYPANQQIWQTWLRRDCSSDEFLDPLMSEYNEDERRYAICNPESGRDYRLVLLFPQVHARIVELGICGRQNELREQLLRTESKRKH